VIISSRDELDEAGEGGMGEALEASLGAEATAAIRERCTGGDREGEGD
jgi:hypothetical protein